MSTEDIGKVDRKQASSRNVDYSKPVTLHETSKSRVELLAYYIARSSGATDLSVTIKTFQKQPPPNNWVENEAKSVSLEDSGARKLYRALGERLAVASEAAGTFLTIPIAGSRADLTGHDPTQVARALSQALGQPEIVRHLAGLDLASELTAALKGAVRISEMRAAISQLRDYLAGGAVDEQVYQEWCERHSWAFGNAYVMRDNVRRITAGDQLDLLLPTVITGYREIVELKRPDMDVVRRDPTHNSYYFSSDASKAIGQCHRYIDVLHKAAASGLDDHPEIVAYHPRAIIIIGRSTGWSMDQARALHGLNHRLAGVVVMTYDQLLAQGERLLEIISDESTRSASPEDT